MKPTVPLIIKFVFVFILLYLHFFAQSLFIYPFQVFKYPGFSEEWSFEVGDIPWMSWHPVANVLFCGTADSEMWMWKIPSGLKLGYLPPPPLPPS